MRVLIYGINFSPEFTGIGKYTGEMVEWLAAQGHEVRVVTAPPYYPDWKVRTGYCPWRYSVEQRAGARVWRAPLWVPFHPSAAKRLLHLASFALTSFPLLLRHLFWRPEVIWVVAPALLCAPGALLAARIAGARSWLHIQDFEVDAAFEMGLLQGPRLRLLALGIEHWLLRRFNRVSAISHRMIEHLYAKGLTQSDAVWFPNWVNTKAIRPLTETVDNDGTAQTAANSYRAALQIAPDVIVALYSGNLGDKQGLEILSQGAELTIGRKDIVWVFCGEGVGRANLEQRCAGLANVRFLPLQPVDRLNELLNLADVHLLPQRGDVADLVMPSKLTGMLASGRPVIATALQGTQVASICEHCGLVVPPGDAEAFAKAVLTLADDACIRLNFGEKARAYAEYHFGHEAILSRFESELQSLVDS